jgi:hypothetical protein
VKTRQLTVTITPYVESLIAHRESLYHDNNRTPVKEWQKKVDKVNTDLAHLVVVAYDKVRK